MDSMNRLVAEQIFVSAGSKDILKGAAVTAGHGSITGLLGRNGAGKSTVLKAIFGTQWADDIVIHVNGHYQKNLYEISGLINFLPSHPFLPPGLKIKTILQHYDVDKERVIHDFPELEADLGKRVFELAGGHERLWSALLLIYSNTRFTMLDEPFTHLAPLYVTKLKEILLREKKNKGFIITDHMYGHLLEVSDTVYLMKDGKTIFIRSKEDLQLHGYLSNNS